MNATTAIATKEAKEASLPKAVVPVQATPVAGGPDDGRGFDPRRFRSALGCFPTGVAVITTQGPDGEPVGLTCNSFSSVSLDPPLVAWSLRLASKSIDVFREARGFTINVLGEDQAALSGRFASSTNATRFDGVSHAKGCLGSPVIEGCVANFQCSTFARHLAGDHLILIGRVEAFGHLVQEPSLVFYRGGYMALAQSLRELAMEGRIPFAQLEAARERLHEVLLRLACEQGQEEDFAAIEQNIRLMESYPTSEMVKRSTNSRQFFDLIAKAARNEVLAMVADSLTTLLYHTLTTQIPLVARPELVPVRWKILDRMRARDAESCVRATSEYFAAFRSDLGSADATAAGPGPD